MELYIFAVAKVLKGYVIKDIYSHGLPQRVAQQMSKLEKTTILKIN
jgi:hypothetical protein